LNEQEIIARLVDDAEESLETMGYIGLHEFIWSLRGYGFDLDRTQSMVIVEAVYEVIRASRDLSLKWTRWPVSPGAWWDASADVDLEFDIDPEANVATPFLLLVEQRPSRG